MPRSNIKLIILFIEYPDLFWIAPCDGAARLAELVEQARRGDYGKT